MMRFFKPESCGQCASCRDGTAEASALIDKPNWDAGRQADWFSAMHGTSMCDLGQAAPNIIECVQKYFPYELG